MVHIIAWGIMGLRVSSLESEGDDLWDILSGPPGESIRTVLFASKN